MVPLVTSSIAAVTFPEATDISPAVPDNTPACVSKASDAFLTALMIPDISLIIFDKVLFIVPNSLFLLSSKLIVKSPVAKISNLSFISFDSVFIILTNL
ncbi:hypothetical protein SDC9_206306 [bioreactor metagenome]|uniref:Uncharacterized protein n=1 Tax=bioreactor metagenome TaxID=1076179 RepID=A0A645J7C9_9ZZZZ